MNIRSVATLGIGFGVLAVSTIGFITAFGTSLVPSPREYSAQRIAHTEPSQVFVFVTPQQENMVYTSPHLPIKAAYPG